MINQANVIEADIMATNGIIHAIDAILVPGDIAQVAQGWEIHADKIML